MPSTAVKKRTVCDVTREIYGIVYHYRRVLGDAFMILSEKLAEQTELQKKMDAKLREYKNAR